MPNFIQKLTHFDTTPIDLKNNAFDFVRLALALVVVYSHAPYVGNYGDEPHLLVRDLYENGITWGTVAMYGFFVISGFLITASFINSKDSWIYFQKRAKRIFPAFWVCLLVSAFIFSPIFYWLSNGNLNNYFPNLAQGVRYFLDNLTTEVKLRIVGNTLNKSHLNELNGPIWSIIFEIRAYILVAILGMVGIFKRKFLILIPFGLFWFAYSGVVFDPNFNQLFEMFFQDRKYAILFAYFFSGALFWVYKDKIIWDWKIFLLMFGLIFWAIKVNFFAPIALVPFSYCLLFLCKALPIQNLGKKIGDASFGVYIYHWPIQQLLFLLGVQKINPNINTWASMVLALIAGFASYHLVEKRFIGGKVVSA
jgi:peptidoglycan/LPS O-acetylase OafA/YrhL